MSKFELSLSPEYVPNWTVVDAVRELFQNALDQQTVLLNNTMFFKYHDNPFGEGTLELGNNYSVLQTSSLLLGASTKRDDPNTIGKFGEGYKIAALVLTRLGKKFTIYNYGAKEVWTFKFVKSRKYGDVQVLTVDVNKAYFWKSMPDNDLTMEIEGITAEEYQLIIASNLHLQEDYKAIETPYGRILIEDMHKGKVYVNGLYVCDNKEFQHGYDVKPKHITIDRDRKAVTDWDLSYITGRMWSSTSVEHGDKIRQLVRDNAKDIHHLHYHSHSTTSYARIAALDFKKEYGVKATPVVNEEQAKMAKKDGKVPVIVSEPMKHMLDSVPTQPYSGPKPYTLYDRFNKWYKRYATSIDKDGKEHFRELLKELKDIDN
jgi:hypothetical protein